MKGCESKTPKVVPCVLGFRRISYHVRSDCEHQRERRAEGAESADDGGTPRLTHLPASWDLADRELEKKRVHVGFL